MAKINIKQFCKEFKAYEEKVGKTAAWRGVLSEVGNAAKNESTRSFEAQGSPFGETWKPLSPATLKKKKGFVKERGDDGKLRVSVIEFKFKPFKSQKNSDKELLVLDNAKRYVKRDIIANKAKNRPNDDNHILLDKLTEKMVRL